MVDGFGKETQIRMKPGAVLGRHVHHLTHASYSNSFLYMLMDGCGQSAVLFYTQTTTKELRGLNKYQTPKTSHDLRLIARRRP
jgi:hypothetical protein